MCTSVGDGLVTDVDVIDGNSSVFEVTFVEDRPVYMAAQDDSLGMVAAFGPHQNVPYNPAEFVEFRFKGRMCSTMGLAEAWLIMVEPGRIQVQVL